MIVATATVTATTRILQDVSKAIPWLKDLPAAIRPRFGRDLATIRQRFGARDFTTARTRIHEHWPNRCTDPIKFEIHMQQGASHYMCVCFSKAKTPKQIPNPLGPLKGFHLALVFT